MNGNRDRAQNPRAAAVTAMADDTDKEEYLKKGFDGFLSKPIAIPNLLRTVASFLDPIPYIVH